MNDVDAWMDAFLKAMDSSLGGRPAAITTEKAGLILTTAEDFDHFLGDYIGELDYFNYTFKRMPLDRMFIFPFSNEN
jgi:hypothetical protein